MTDDLSPEDADVVPFVATPRPSLPRLGDPPALVRKPIVHSDPGCPHRAKEIDAKLRRIKCKECGETLDPIECLLDLATYSWQVKHQLEETRAYRVKELESEARAMARKHPLTKEGAVIPGGPSRDPGITWKRYEAARAAADKLPLADRLGLLVKARLLSVEELATILMRVEDAEKAAAQATA